MSEHDKMAGDDMLPKDEVSHHPADTERLAMYEDAEALRRQLKVPVLLPTGDSHARLIVVAFDGTGNDKFKDPEHATNVAKISDQFEDVAKADQRIFVRYMAGPGTQDDALTRTTDLALGHTYRDRLEEMYGDVARQAKEWRQQDSNVKIGVLNTGFSRGGSQAAGFTRLLDERGIVDLDSETKGSDGKLAYTRHIVPPGQIRQVAGLFDPVATGLPMEFDRRLPSSVEARLQLTAIDERRIKFVSDRIVPMGLSDDGRSLNTWVPGAHSDAGGGYLRDGLSRRCGNLMIGFCNSVSDRPLLKPLDVPDDPHLNVVHRSEEGMRGLYQLDAQVDRRSPEGVNTRIGGIPGYVGGKVTLGSATALGVVASVYDAARTGERVSVLLAQDNLLGAKHEARDFAVNNANAWAAAYAVGTLGAELGGRRGVYGAAAGALAGGIVGYVLSDKAMAGLDAREIVNQTDALSRPWTFNGRQWVKPMQADLHDDGVNRPHAQAFSADFDTRPTLDYEATHTAVDITLRRLPPRNPYRRIARTPDAAFTAMEICP